MGLNGMFCSKIMFSKHNIRFSKSYFTFSIFLGQEIVTIYQINQITNLNKCTWKVIFQSKKQKQKNAKKNNK